MNQPERTHWSLLCTNKTKGEIHDQNKSLLIVAKLQNVNSKSIMNEL